MITLQAETVPVEPTPYILAWDGSIPPPVPQFDDTRDQPSDSEPCCTSSFLPADFTLHTFEVRPRCRVCQTPFLLRLRDALPDRPMSCSPLTRWAADSAAMIVSAQTVGVSAFNCFEDSREPETGFLVMSVTFTHYSHNSCELRVWRSAQEPPGIPFPPPELF